MVGYSDLKRKRKLWAGTRVFCGQSLVRWGAGLLRHHTVFSLITLRKANGAAHYATARDHWDRGRHHHWISCRRVSLHWQHCLSPGDKRLERPEPQVQGPQASLCFHFVSSLSLSSINPTSHVIRYVHNLVKSRNS